MAWSAFLDSNGNITQKTDPNGNTISYTAYDGLNRLLAKSYTGASTPAVTYCYDASAQTGACASAPNGSGLNLNGRLTMVSNSNSSTAYGQFDNLGNDKLSAQKTNSAVYGFSYSWNLVHGRTGMTLPSGRALTWQYDALNRVNGISGVFQGTGTTYAGSVQYASNSAVSQMVRGDGLWEERYYDPLRLQLQSITVGTSATDSSYLSLGLAYCAGGASSCTTNNGNLMQQTIQPLGATQSYQYTDGRNRLNTVQESSPAGTWSRTYSYDAYGNGWLSGYTTGAPSPGVSVLTPTANIYNISPGSGPVNRMTGSNYGYDNNGNQTFMSPYTLGYDAENRQVAATSLANGSATYAYDGDGRRVMKTVNSGTPTVYVYDAGGELVAEYGATPSIAGTNYVTTDHLGSTRMVTTGNVPSRHDYLPFGEELETSNRTSGNGYSDADSVEQKFTGKERDGESGLDFFGARYVSGSQARFTSPDPMNIGASMSSPQSWNAYTYVNGNPLNFIDPNGLRVSAVVDGMIYGDPFGGPPGTLWRNGLVACPENTCSRFNDNGDFEQFVATGGAAAYIKFSDLAQGISEWNGQFYTNEQFQQQVVQPLIDSQHAALAAKISSLNGQNYQDVYSWLTFPKVKGSNADFLADPQLDLRFLSDPNVSFSLRTFGAPSVHEHANDKPPTVHMDTASPYPLWKGGVLGHFFVDVLIGNINGSVPFPR